MSASHPVDLCPFGHADVADATRRQARAVDERVGRLPALTGPTADAKTAIRGAVAALDAVWRACQDAGPPPGVIGWYLARWREIHRQAERIAPGEHLVNAPTWRLLA